MFTERVTEAFMEEIKKDPEGKDLITNIKETLRKIDSPPSGADKECEERRKDRRQVPVDLVEEEGMESFPASDSPGHMGSSTGRSEPRRPSDQDV